MSDPVLTGGIVADPVLGGNVSDPALAGSLFGGQGPAGAAGKSAYELAGGDAEWGSLATWLASLAALRPRTYPVVIAAAGQTVIPLPVPPAVPSSVRLVVNGCTYAAPDITIGPTTVVWVDPDFILEPGDAVLLSYV